MGKTICNNISMLLKCFLSKKQATRKRSKWRDNLRAMRAFLLAAHRAQFFAVRYVPQRRLNAAKIASSCYATAFVIICQNFPATNGWSRRAFWSAKSRHRRAGRSIRSTYAPSTIRKASRRRAFNTSPSHGRLAHFGRIGQSSWRISPKRSAVRRLFAFIDLPSTTVCKLKYVRFSGFNCLVKDLMQKFSSC